MPPETLGRHDAGNGVIHSHVLREQSRSVSDWFSALFYHPNIFNGAATRPGSRPGCLRRGIRKHASCGRPLDRNSLVDFNRWEVVDGLEEVVGVVGVEVKHGDGKYFKDLAIAEPGGLGRSKALIA